MSQFAIVFAASSGTGTITCIMTLSEAGEAKLVVGNNLCSLIGSLFAKHFTSEERVFSLADGTHFIGPD